MNPFLELQRLLAAKKLVLSGSVTKVDAGKLQVRTQVGIIFANVTDATDYRVGDNVLVDSGVVKGKLKNSASIPVYHV